MPHSHDYILAHLNLRAVLPAICDLAAVSKEVQDRIDGSDFALILGVFGDVETTLYFHDSKVEIITDSQGQSLSLRCPTHRQINSLFENRGYYFPIIAGNYLLLPKLFMFSKIAEKLERFLRPDATELKNPEFFARHSTALFKIIMRSIGIVGELDGEARDAVRALPDGLAILELEDSGISAWVRVEKRKISSGIGTPNDEPDVVVKFRNTQVFYAAANQRLDTMAAVSKGDIRVSGLIPLADGLDLVMKRIGIYLSI